MTAVVTDQRTGHGRRITDLRSLPDFGNLLAGYCETALEDRCSHGADFALDAFFGNVRRLAKELGVTDSEGRHI